MTREEAIEQLKLTRAANKCNYADKYILDAFDMAIRSLEAWEKIRKEIASDGQSDINAKYVLNLIDKHLSEVNE